MTFAPGRGEASPAGDAGARRYDPGMSVEFDRDRPAGSPGTPTRRRVA